MINLKQYITEKNVFYLLIFILILTTITDLYTALTTDIFYIAETNPIFLHFNLYSLLLLTILITVYIIYQLKKAISLTSIFIISLVTIYLSIGHIGGAYSNIITNNKYLENPEKQIKYYKSVTKEEKVNNYLFFVGLIMVLPIILSFFAFIITNYFHNQRKPEREKIMDEIENLIFKLKKWNARIKPVIIGKRNNPLSKGTYGRNQST